MDYPQINTKIWSCVGSAGVVDVADLGKVDFVGPVVKLHGINIGATNAASDVVESPRPTAEQPRATPALRSPVQTQAVVRFGITPNLFSGGIFYTINLFGKCGSGQIDASLMLVGRPEMNTSVEVTNDLS
jgi:hypothetical protein